MSDDQAFSIASPPGQVSFPATDSIHWDCGKCSGAKGWKNRHKKTKVGAKGAHMFSSMGVSIAQNQVAGASVAAAVVGSAALSATGIGLLAGSVALTAGSTYAANRSRKKTQAHIEALKSIHKQRNSYACEGIHGPVHSYIASTILPYIISQKTTKLSRKKNQMIPAVGAGYEAAKSIKHSVKKRWQGVKGQQRSFAAQWLAVHMLTHHCELTEAIVAELYSAEEKEMLKLCGSDAAASMIENKLKSI